MIAYNKNQLDNVYVHEQLKEAYEQNYITKDEQEKCINTYPVGFYMPNIFIRSGLFLLTFVIAGFSFGLIGMLFITGSSETFISGLIFFGLLAYGVLEFGVNRKHYFRSGVDDALLWLSAIFVVSAFLVSNNDSSLTVSIVVFVVSFYLSARFADRAMSGVTCLAFLAACFFTVSKWGDAAKTIAPFLLMMIAFFIYWLSISEKLRSKWKYHGDCLTTIEIVALICFYLAGNYYVVREASIAMFHLDLKEGQDIPFGWFFWIWTVAVPLIYLARGIQKRNIILLRSGLVLIAGFVFTIRYYYHFIAIETAMIAGGIFMTACAYFLIKYLSVPKHGFIYKEPVSKQNIGIAQIESLAVAQTFGQSPGNTINPTEFGGGTGGGGGAGGEF